jgi:hypothetical protein
MGIKVQYIVDQFNLIYNLDLDPQDVIDFTKTW